MKRTVIATAGRMPRGGRSSNHGKSRLRPFATPPRARSLSSNEPMRFVTWNMGCGSPRYTERYRRVRDEAWRMVLSLEPDVILVQEALLDTPEWVRAEGIFLPQRLHYDGQDAGTAILVRSGLMATNRFVTIGGSYVAAADIVGTDGEFVVASVHVDTKDQKKNLLTLLDALVQVTEGRRFIIGGDFNACRRYDEVYKKNAYRWFFDELGQRGFHDCHYGVHGREERTFWGHQAKEAYQLDHFFIESTGKARVRSCVVITTDDTKRLSDHSPVLLELG